MATVLDVGLVHYFSPVIMFLFILVLIYAVLSKFSFFGENKNIRMVIAFCVAALFLFSESARKFIDVTTPWFVVMMVMVLFLLVILMFIGLSESDLAKAAREPQVYWVVIVLSLLVLIISFVFVFGEKASPYTGGDDGVEKTRISEGLNALIHPRVLGALFLLIIATFAARFISASL